MISKVVEMTYSESSVVGNLESFGDVYTSHRTWTLDQ